MPRWRFEHDVVISSTGQIHRAQCPDARDDPNGHRAADAELESNSAPELCEHCRPDVTLLLGHPRPPADA